MCDEIGSEGTYHIHLYICFQNAKAHTVFANAFPGAHRKNVKGTSQQNRDYVLKDGEKYNKQPDGTYDYVDGSSMYGDAFGKSLCHAWTASPIYLIARWL